MGVGVGEGGGALALLSVNAATHLDELPVFSPSLCFKHN